MSETEFMSSANRLDGSIRSFVGYVNAKSHNSRQKGEIFELAIKKFLIESPEYNFEDVWTWKEWPVKYRKKYQHLAQDTGIDLVAKEKTGETFWAVQCKCYAENARVSKSDIDKFLATSSKNPFSYRLLVTTTTNFSPPASKALENQNPPCKTLTLSDLEKTDFEWLPNKVKRTNKLKKMWPHQQKALEKAVEHFKTHDRGKLIMACGTGKTFTSLKITEKLMPKTNSKVLFLAPSIALISQTLREYAYERQVTQDYLIVCSDSKTGRDSDGFDVDDLQIPPTTDPEKIVDRLKTSSNTIVFCTYQSLKRINEAQKALKFEFDLVICDEAHRTAGISKNDKQSKVDQENDFTLINDGTCIKAKNRLYMTATPKIYSEKTKRKANKYGTSLQSMDDEVTFGKEFYRLDFSEAIEQKLLSDYKVIILTISQKYAAEHLQDALKNQVQKDTDVVDKTNLNLSDASRLVGCYKALRDQGDKHGTMLKRAVAFLKTIKDSKAAQQGFQQVVDTLDDYENDGFTCETKHIDGTDNSITRNEKLDWLKQNTGSNEHGQICRILMNSKCLTEGVDVPNLDAVMFLHPRKSQVDVVQAVGRVMRKQQNKHFGYVVLPVVVPQSKTPRQALDDNKTYKVVWQVLNALRSHDDKFDCLINNLKFTHKTDKIKIVDIGHGSNQTEEIEENTIPGIKKHTEIQEIEKAIYARIVDKCGDRMYSDKFAEEAKDAYEEIKVRIKALIETKPKIQNIFNSYIKQLQDSINPDVDSNIALQMLAQHITTKKGFDSIFVGYKFSEHNPVSLCLGKVLSALEEYGLEAEIKELDTCYISMEKRLKSIDNSAGRQAVIKEFYEDFIKQTFPDMSKKLGVAYTPIEIVDFILHSVDWLLKKHFRKGLTDEEVHVIDPFSGTGTFINRCLQNETLIHQKDLARKFNRELHANEIMLLPYYISSINIEEAFYHRSNQDSKTSEKYTSFKGMTLTDTFHCYQQLDNDDCSLETANKQRIKTQKKANIQVLVGNPPYSVGQKSENDGNKNTSHPILEGKIQNTYIKASTAKNDRPLYDSYIKAFRWATDRLKGNGVIGFVHNASLIDGESLSGVRKCLVEEFDAIYCLNLRGNQRTNGDVAKKEGGKIFGSSSRTPIAITLLVKKPIAKQVENRISKPTNVTELKNNKITESCDIYYHDIGDYLSREEKLNKIKNFKSITRVKWQKITPDKHSDWVNQRNENFYDLIPLDSSKNNSLFKEHSSGIQTSRDSWAYNFSEKQVGLNIKNMIEFYNNELDRLKNTELNENIMDKYINRDKDKIKWSSSLKKTFIKKKYLEYNESKIRLSSYRPFERKFLYYDCDKDLNHRISDIPSIFPNNDTENLVICVSGSSATYFSVLITNITPCGDYIEKAKCFPLYIYDNKGNKQDAIQDDILDLFKKHLTLDKQKNINNLDYKNFDPSQITKEDIFYYIYAMLHSKSYIEKYKDTLNKELPHIPISPQFNEFCKIGKKLADLHLRYEYQQRLDCIDIEYQEKFAELQDYKVRKIKILRDKTSIQFNETITISNIPQEAFEYKVNGRSPIEWVVKRYEYKKDKDSQLINDPNTYKKDDDRYVFDLLLSVITVSYETVKLINKLPKDTTCLRDNAKKAKLKRGS